MAETDRQVELSAAANAAAVLLRATEEVDGGEHRVATPDGTAVVKAEGGELRVILPRDHRSVTVEQDGPGIAL